MNSVRQIVYALARLAKHERGCTYAYLLPTGGGYYECSCGVDSLTLDGEPDARVIHLLDIVSSALRYVHEFDGQPMSMESYSVIAKRARAALVAFELGVDS